MLLDDHVISLPFRPLVKVCCALPGGALIVCVLVALSMHYDASTRTHCRVSNWLPSLSAAIGGDAPERYIWRVAIALHCAPRLLVGFVYRNFYKTCPLRKVRDNEFLSLTTLLLALLHLAEIMSLVLLAMISSIEHHSAHAVFFTLFVVSSVAYMALNTYIFDFSGRRRSFTQGELSYQHKALSLLASVLCILLAAYFYYRHNAYCEPGVYTLFALAEYLFVACNIWHHSTIGMDLHDKSLCLVSMHSYDALLPTEEEPLRRTE